MKTELLWFLALFLGCSSESGCSFKKNNREYVVKLEQQECKDERTATLQANDDDTQCCTGMQTQVTNLQNEMSQMAQRITEILKMTPVSTSATLLQSTHAPTASEQRLMQMLVQREAEATSYKDTLAQKKLVLQTATAKLLQKEHEVNTSKETLEQETNSSIARENQLKGQVSNLTRDLNNCRGVLSMITGVFNPIKNLTTTINMTYCPFEDSGLCGFTNGKSDKEHWSWRYRSHSDTTGPREDHTFGSPKGHYVSILPYITGETSPIDRFAHLISPSLQPHPNYCIRFWYNMFGPDVKTLNVYAQVGQGLGYPIWTKSGTQGGDWHLAEVKVGSEYTKAGFNVVIEANDAAYFSYGSINHITGTRLKIPHMENGDIAIDDLYIYNISCEEIPTIPEGSYIRKDNGSSSAYTFHTFPSDWYQSYLTCRREGATSHLVSINSKEEQEYLVNAIKANPTLTAGGHYGLFTSGNDERSEHHFDWTDTGTPYTSSYIDWHTGQPNNVGNTQNCLLLQYDNDDYTWGDVDCSEKHPFICEVDIPTIG